MTQNFNAQVVSLILQAEYVSRCSVAMLRHEHCSRSSLDGTAKIATASAGKFGSVNDKEIAVSYTWTIGAAYARNVRSLKMGVRTCQCSRHSLTITRFF